MKKYVWLITLLCCALGARAADLKLSPEGKKEAALFMDFLTAVYLQDAPEPRSFNAYRKALQKDPDSLYLKRQLVAAALTENRLEEAHPYADFITPQSDADDYTVRAAYLWKTGQIAEAEKNYEQALALAPDDSRILYQYIVLLSYAEPDKAVQKLEEHAEQYPVLAPYAYVEIGNLYMNRQNFALAKKYYDKSAAADPELPAARLGRAAVYERLGRYMPMRMELLAAEELGAASVTVYTRIAASYWLEQNTEQAQRYFLKAKRLDNGDVTAALSLTEMSRRRGDFGQAFAYLRDAKDFDSNADRWIQAAELLYQQEDLAGAADLLGRAYKKFKGNVEIGYLYAVVLCATHQNARALKVLDRLLAENSEYNDARIHRAAVYERLGRYERMEDDLRAVEETDPQNPYAASIRAGSLADRGVRLDEAERLAVRALEKNPSSETALDTLAWVYFKQGRVQEAADLLFSLPPDRWQKEPHLAYHMGAVCFAAGRYEEARVYLDKARPFVKEAAKLYKKLPRRVSAPSR